MHKNCNSIPKDFCLDTYVIPTQTNYKHPKRELADLAVVVRRKNGTNFSYRMWLLQAKKLSSGTAALPSGNSTDKEVELLEIMPDFNFIRSNKKLSLISLRKDFGNIAQNFKHWAFLAIMDDPNNYPLNPSQPPNPFEWRWLGRGSGQVSQIKSSSFTASLLSMCQSTPQNGASVDKYSGNLEWRKLWIELFSSYFKASNNFADGDIFKQAYMMGFIPTDDLFDPFVMSHNMDSLFSGEISVIGTGFSRTDRYSSVMPFLDFYISILNNSEEPKDQEEIADELQTNNDGIGGRNNNIPGRKRDRPIGGIGHTLIIDMLD